MCFYTFNGRCSRCWSGSACASSSRAFRLRTYWSLDDCLQAWSAGHESMLSAGDKYLYMTITSGLEETKTKQKKRRSQMSWWHRIAHKKCVFARWTWLLCCLKLLMTISYWRECHDTRKSTTTISTRNGLFLFIFVLIMKIYIVADRTRNHDKADNGRERVCPFSSCDNLCQSGENKLCVACTRARVSIRWHIVLFHVFNRWWCLIRLVI